MKKFYEMLKRLFFAVMAALLLSQGALALGAPRRLRFCPPVCVVFLAQGEGASVEEAELLFDHAKNRADASFTIKNNAGKRSITVAIPFISKMCNGGSVISEVMADDRNITPRLRVKDQFYYQDYYKESALASPDYSGLYGILTAGDHELSDGFSPSEDSADTDSELGGTYFVMCAEVDIALEENQTVELSYTQACDFGYRAKADGEYQHEEFSQVAVSLAKSWQSFSDISYSVRQSPSMGSYCGTSFDSKAGNMCRTAKTPANAERDFEVGVIYRQPGLERLMTYILGATLEFIGFILSSINPFAVVLLLILAVAAFANYKQKK